MEEKGNKGCLQMKLLFRSKAFKPKLSHLMILKYQILKPGVLKIRVWSVCCSLQPLEGTVESSCCNLISDTLLNLFVVCICSDNDNYLIRLRRIKEFIKQFIVVSSKFVKNINIKVSNG